MRNISRAMEVLLHLAYAIARLYPKHHILINELSDDLLRVDEKLAKELDKEVRNSLFELDTAHYTTPYELNDVNVDY